MATKSILTPEELERAIRIYGDYMVALCCLCTPTDQDVAPRTVFCPGFILVLARNCWWVTAGHVLRDFESETKNGKAKFSGFRLIDHYGQGKDCVHHLPFDFDGARKIYEYSESLGIDYAFVQLNKLTVDCLKANAIAPVVKKDWESQDELEYTGYFMMGLPYDDHEDFITTGRSFDIVSGRSIPSAIHVDRIVKPAKEYVSSKYPRFVGKLNRYKEGDIKGMSGGPIFGIAKNGQHRIVAIQSSWIESKRITFGFLVPRAVMLLERALKRRGQEMGNRKASRRRSTSGRSPTD